MSTLHEERMARFRKAGLYLVTSADMSGGRTTLEIIRAALDAGVRLFQLREKNLSAREVYGLAEQARNLTAEAGALLIINDRLDIALAAGADGVHLGQDDLPVRKARLLAPDLVIGASSHSVAEALAAAESGASYVNIGPVFPTGTKKWQAEFLGIDIVRAVAREIKIPFTVMGGIKKQHIADLKGAGANVIAVVTAVTAAPDPENAARELLGLIKAD